MKILHLHDRALCVGGAERAVIEAAAGLRSFGCESHLLVPDESSPQFRGRASSELLGGRAPSSMAASRAFSSVVRLDPGREGPQTAEWVRSERPDLILVHNLRALPGDSELGFRPAIRMVHDLSPLCPRGSRVRRWSGELCRRSPGVRCTACLAVVERRAGSRWGWAVRSPLGFARERHLLDRYAGLIAPSQTVSEHLRAAGVSGAKIHCVPLGLSFAAAPGPPRGRVLLVGTLVRGKGFDTVLRSLAMQRELLALRLGEDFQVDVVGAGPERSKLERLAGRLGLGSRVHFEGWLPPSGLALRYAKADLVVLGSRIPEAFGLVGVEAMASGRPVVATPAGGFSEWLLSGETGVIASDSGPVALAEALAEALAVPGRLALYGEAGRRRYRELFTREMAAKRLFRAIERIIGSSGEVAAPPEIRQCPV